MHSQNRLTPTSASASIRFGALALTGLALVGGVMLLTAPSTSFASLRIADETPHARLWERIYDKLPPQWKTSQRIIVQEVSEEEMSRLIRSNKQDESDNLTGDDAQIDGCYQSGEKEDDPPTITLTESLSNRESEMVFSHEYGHFIWEEKLSNRSRDRYTEIWRRQKRAHHLITEYAEDAEDEGFAEAFAYYLRQPDKLRRKDRASWEFLHNLTQPQSDDEDSPDAPDDAH